MSKLRARKPAHTTNPRQKAVIKPHWWNKEAQTAWTDKRTMVKLWQIERSKPQPEAATHTMSSLPTCCTDCTCHHSHRLNKPPTKGMESGMGCPTGTQPCTVFGCKDFCRSTAMGTPELVGMNGQIDWQAQQISRLVCSLAGQRCFEAGGTF